MVTRPQTPCPSAGARRRSPGWRGGNRTRIQEVRAGHSRVFVCSYVRVCVRSRALAGRALFLAPLSPPQPPGWPTWRGQTVPLGPCQSTPARIGGQGSLMPAPGWPCRLPSGMPWGYQRGEKGTGRCRPACAGGTWAKHCSAFPASRLATGPGSVGFFFDALKLWHFFQPGSVQTHRALFFTITCSEPRSRFRSRIVSSAEFQSDFQADSPWL